VKIKTSRFGELEIESGKIIFIPEGVLGFPAFKRFILLETMKEGPFAWLQAVDNPDLAFIVMDPYMLDEDFEAPLYPKDLTDLKAGHRQDVTFLLIVSVNREGEPCVIANLQGPLAINHNSFIGKQLVLHAKEVPVLRTPAAVA
jgi:flagellar assembly factor FliW